MKEISEKKKLGKEIRRISTAERFLAQRLSLPSKANGENQSED